MESTIQQRDTRGRIEPTPAAPPTNDELLDHAEAMLDNGEHERAEAMFGAALAEHATSRAHMGMARCAHLSGDLHRSLGHLHAVQRVHPMYPRLANDLGVIYFKLGLSRAAIEHLEAAAEQAPDDPLPLRNLIDVSLATGDLEGCCDFARRLIAIDPHDEETRAIIEMLA